MARPTTKETLLFQGNDNFDKLNELIDSLTTEQQLGEFPFEGRDRNIRDSLCHLYEWHQLFINWFNANSTNQKQPFLPEPYNWKTYPQMNQKIWEACQNTSLEEARESLKNSHQECMAIIETLSDEELFTKKYFDWTGTTNLGSYAISATSSHYDWALKNIKKYKRSLK